MAATAWLQSRDFYEVYRWGICAGLTGSGIVAWIVGAIVNARRRNRPSSNAEDSAPEPFLLLNLSYWGIMFIVFGVVVVFIVPTKKSEPIAVVVRAAAKPPQKVLPPPTNAPVVVPSNPQRSWPALKLQGVAHVDGKSSVLINGKTYFVGDHVGDTIITAIEREAVTLELDYQTRVLEITNSSK